MELEIKLFLLCHCCIFDGSDPLFSVNFQMKTQNFIRAKKEGNEIDPHTHKAQPFLSKERKSQLSTASEGKQSHKHLFLCGDEHKLGKCWFMLVHGLSDPTTTMNF